MKKIIFTLIILTLLILINPVAFAEDSFAERSRGLGEMLLLSMGFNVNAMGQPSVTSIVGRYIYIALSFIGVIFMILVLSLSKTC